MKIGFCFSHTQNSFYSHTSMTTEFKALGRCWLKSGHEILFINKKGKMLELMSLPQIFVEEYEDLLPFSVEAKREGFDLDVSFDFYDYGSMGYSMTPAKNKSGIFIWALSPLSKHYTKLASDHIKPFFITGRKSYEEALGYGIDAHLFQVGVDPNVFNTCFRPKNDVIKFLFVGGASVAAGPDLLIHAYFSEFTSKDNVSLTIVSPKNTVGGLVYEINERWYKDCDVPKIEFVRGDKLPSEMAAIYKSHDALVIPLRFHGGCHPISEAMACGTLVITTNWTGPTDYAAEDEALWVDYKLENVYESSKELEKYAKMKWFTNYFSQFGTDTTYIWAKPSVPHLATLMRNVYDGNYDKTIVDRAAEKAKTFSWDKIAGNMMQVLEQHVK